MKTLRYLQSCYLLIIVAGLTGCVMQGSGDKYEWVGGFNGGNVVYTINKIGDDKYTFVADTVASVKPDQLIAAAKGRADRLCQPKSANFQYQITNSVYMATVTAVLSMPENSPKLTGIVQCK